MGSINYRCITPKPRILEVPVAASQKFYHEGASFVVLDNNGQARVALTADGTIYGMAEVPAGRGAGTDDTYWLSSATAGKDKIAVIVDDDARYLVPSVSAIAQSDVGNAYDLIGVNDGTQQKLDPAHTATKVLVVDGLGTSINGGVSTDAIVKINPVKFQAD